MREDISNLKCDWVLGNNCITPCVGFVRAYNVTGSVENFRLDVVELNRQ